MKGAYRSYFAKPVGGSCAYRIRWAVRAEDIYVLVADGYQRVPCNVARQICIAERHRRKREDASGAGPACRENTGDTYMYPFGWDMSRTPNRIVDTYTVLD